MMYGPYDPATGRILQCNSYSSGGFEVELAPGQDDGTHYVNDGTAVPFPTRPSPSHVWDWAQKAWVDARTLAEAKAQARQRLGKAYEVARASGVTVGGKVAPTDPASLLRYLYIKTISAESGWTDVPIPLADGSFELLTQAKAAALWTALKTMERTLLSRLKARVDQVNAATTTAQVDAVTW